MFVISNMVTIKQHQLHNCNEMRRVVVVVWFVPIGHKKLMIDERIRGLVLMMFGVRDDYRLTN
jgi:hypothetical protein